MMCFFIIYSFFYKYQHNDIFIEKKKMNITLNTPKEIVVVEQQIKTINQITITRMVDLPLQKKVLVFTNEVGQIVLWEGAAYEAIGQWTDQDVIARLNELYS